MSPGTILIADDSPVDALVVKFALQRAGFLNPISTVSDGEEARAFLNGEDKYADRTLYPPAILLILDLQMPRKTGVDVLEWLNTRSDLDSVRVLVLTSHGDLSRLNQVYRLGADAFLTKPLRFPDLMNALRGLRNTQIQESRAGRLLVNVASARSESKQSHHSSALPGASQKTNVR